MTWSQKDIIADIKRQGFDVDTSLPYWELRRKYRQVRYIKAYLGSGSFDFAHAVNERPPKSEVDKTV